MSRFERDRLPNLDEVWGWYDLQLLLLNEEDERLPQLLKSDSIPERYRDETLADLRVQFVSARAEAGLRLAFRDLSTHQRKSAISRRFRKIKQERQMRIRLTEDILDTWMEVYPQMSQSIREFKGVVPLRDWLAYGRYWTPKKLGRPKYSVRDVFDIASNMLTAMQEAGA